MTDYASPNKYKEGSVPMTHSQQLEELAGDIEALFDEADHLMINERNYIDAVSGKIFVTVTQRTIYERIISVDPDNVDALHSIASCIKHTHNSFD